MISKMCEGIQLVAQWNANGNQRTIAGRDFVCAFHKQGDYRNMYYKICQMCPFSMCLVNTLIYFI